MKFLIANCLIELCVKDEQMPDLWLSMYPAFQVDETAERESVPDITLHLVPKKSWDNNYSVKILESYEDGQAVLRVRAPWSMGHFVQREFGYEGFFTTCTQNQFGLYITLRIALAMFLEQRGGLLLHASGVWDGEKVWVFSGPSNSGKTTIATELKGRGDTFSEDQVALQFDSHGVLQAHATPLGEVFDKYECSASGPVAGILFIEQATETKIVTLSSHDAIVGMYKNSNWCQRSSRSAQRALAAIHQIVESGVCHRLQFTRDTSLWSVLQTALQYDNLRSSILGDSRQ